MIVNEFGDTSGIESAMVKTSRVSQHTLQLLHFLEVANLLCCMLNLAAVPCTVFLDPLCRNTCVEPCIMSTTTSP